MSNVEKAMTAATDRETLYQGHLKIVASSPSQLLAHSLTNMTELRDRHMLRRIELEAEHKTNIDSIKGHYQVEKDKINTSIIELEKQLGVMRDAWSRVCSQATADLQNEKERWAEQDRAQARLITAETLMIEELKK